MSNRSHDAKQQKHQTGHGSSARNRQNPSPVNRLSNVPTHGLYTLDRADADDRTRDRVSGTDRNTTVDSHKQTERAGRLRGKPADGFKPGESSAHRVHNSPASRQGTQGHSRVEAQDHPKGNR